MEAGLMPRFVAFGRGAFGAGGALGHASLGHAAANGRTQAKTKNRPCGRSLNENFSRPDRAAWLPGRDDA